jgi:hypothetical protein
MLALERRHIRLSLSADGASSGFAGSHKRGAFASLEWDRIEEAGPIVGSRVVPL